jgi:thymidylate synthase (FAD)
MNVKLVSYTQPTDEYKHLGLDNIQELIAYCAKVSNPSNQVNKATSEKLIKYLIKHQHWSPLEMVNACLEIKTTRDIAHQIVRHRSFSFQEFSQRYADPTQMEDWYTTKETRLQDPVNRQNSIPTEDVQLTMDWFRYQQGVIEASERAYEWAITNGIAKEQARAVLPEGLTKTTLYMNGTLRSWVHYIDLRSAHGTQKEHMEIAHACAIAIAKIFPLIGDIA